MNGFRERGGRLVNILAYVEIYFAHTVVLGINWTNEYPVFFFSRMKLRDFVLTT